jgi:hypothetical protein
MADLLLRRASDSRPGADGLEDYDVIGTGGPFSLRAVL